MSRFDSDSSSFRDRKSDFGGGGYSGGGGFGGGSGGRGGGYGGGSNRDLENIALPQLEFENLIPFEKNFDVEHPAVSALSEASFPDVPTSGAANTRGKSRASRQQRGRWSNLCFCLTFDFCSISIQTILLVVFLPIFPDEPAHTSMQAWVIGSGIGCLLCHTYESCREQFNRLPQAVSISPGSEVDESQANGLARFEIQILKWLWRSLDIFLGLWFGVGIGIVYTRWYWATTQAPRLNWLCTIFLGIAFFRFIVVVTVGMMVSIWFGIRVLLRYWPRGAKANVISALPTEK